MPGGELVTERVRDKLIRTRVSRSLSLVPLSLLLGMWVYFPIQMGSAAPSTVQAAERQAETAFRAQRFEDVARLIESFPSDRRLSPKLLTVAVKSYVRLGRPEAAAEAYLRLVRSGLSDDARLLHDVAFAFLTGYARDRLDHLRIAAYTALTELGTRETAPLLEDGLLDSSVVVRAKSAEGLARAGAAAKSSGLRRALVDPALAVRIAALNALGDSGDAGLLKLIEPFARSAEGPEEAFALAAAVKLGRIASLDALVGLATGPDEDTRIAALAALGRLKHPSTLKTLTQGVYDPSPSVRAFACGALGEFNSPDAAPFLTHALGDDHPRVRSVAAAGLGRLHLAHTRPLLWQAARDPVEYVRAGAVEGLLHLGDQEALLVAADLVKHADPMVRSAAAHALAAGSGRRGKQLLESLLRDQQPQPRLAAARAIGRSAGRDAVPILREGLGDSDAAVRIATAGSLLSALKPSGRQNRSRIPR